MSRVKDKIGLLGLIAAAWALPFHAAAATESVAASTATAAPATQPIPRPAMWLLADEDTRIYLFGTIHILPPGLNWRSATLDRIVGEADELVLEIADEPDDEASIALLRPMVMAKQVPILSRVSPDRRAALREMLAATGLPLERFDHLHSWAVALTLSVHSIGEAYATEDVPMEALTGVEEALRADFSRAARPIRGVETVAQQLGFFQRMSLREQRAFLEAIVDSYIAGEEVSDPQEMGWLTGDVEAIAAEMESMPPELYEQLLTRRNAAWTRWLVERLEQPGTVLFAVGAGHLAGRDSVQSMLAARGLGVVRLD